jgi:predicted site-specific integrase-resolvase
MSEQSTILSGYLDQDELAAQLKVSASTLERWRCEGRGPPVTRLSRQPIYSIAGVQQWLKDREQKMPREGRRKHETAA